jgi:hypothetical protein
MSTNHLQTLTRSSSEEVEGNCVCEPVLPRVSMRGLRYPCSWILSPATWCLELPLQRAMLAMRVPVLLGVPGLLFLSNREVGHGVARATTFTFFHQVDDSIMPMLTGKLRAIQEKRAAA